MTFRRIGKTAMGMLAVVAAIFLASCFNAPPVRDNVIVHSTKLEHGQRMVIVDNAGIGGTSSPTRSKQQRIAEAYLPNLTVHYVRYGTSDIFREYVWST